MYTKQSKYAHVPPSLVHHLACATWLVLLVPGVHAEGSGPSGPPQDTWAVTSTADGRAVLELSGTGRRQHALRARDHEGDIAVLSLNARGFSIPFRSDGRHWLHLNELLPSRRTLKASGLAARDEILVWTSSRPRMVLNAKSAGAGAATTSRGPRPTRRAG